MQCKCGGEITKQEHRVKTLNTALNWFDNVLESDLPITVVQMKCNGCTQTGYKIFDIFGEKIKQHG